MTQKAVVKKILDKHVAEIEVQRQSACGNDCSKCGGCGAPTERIQAQALNQIGACVGETVTIEGKNAEVYRAATVVYAVPLVLFFIVYAIVKLLGSSEGAAAIAGILGFVCGVSLAVWYNRYVKLRGMTPFVIIKRS